MQWSFCTATLFEPLEAVSSFVNSVACSQENDQITLLHQIKFLWSGSLQKGWLMGTDITEGITSNVL